MRKVVYVYTGKYGYNTSLTIGKTYDVISYRKNKDFMHEVIVLNNDYGNNEWFFLYAGYNTPFFEDVTSEYRNEIIDGILT